MALYKCVYYYYYYYKWENMSVNVVSQVSNIISKIPLRVLNSKC